MHLIRTQEFAKRYGISRQMASIWLRAGKVPGAQKLGAVWAIDAQALEGWQPPELGRPGRPRHAQPSLMAKYKRIQRAKQAIDNS